MIAALVAVLAVLVIVSLFALVQRIGEQATTTPTGQAGPGATVVVPLGLADVGFERGTVEETTSAEGPEAASYCDNVPVTDGLVEWSGNRLTEDGGRRRVAQLVARFQSSIDASAFVASHSTIIDCEEWEAESGESALRLTVVEDVPETIHGDETKQFSLEASGTGPVLFLRTVLVRSGADIAQFTFVSANRQDLTLLDDIVARAVARLGF